MNKCLKIITKTLEIVLVVFMAAIVLDVTWQVVTRFLLKDPSSYTEELAGFMLIWIGLLGSSYALHTKSHLGIDLLTNSLVGRTKQWIEVSIYTLISLFALFVLIMGGIYLVNLTFTLHQVSAAMGIPMGYVYLVLPMTGILMIFYSCVSIRAVFSKESKESTVL